MLVAQMSCGDPLSCLLLVMTERTLADDCSENRTLGVPAAFVPRRLDIMIRVAARDYALRFLSLVSV